MRQTVNPKGRETVPPEMRSATAQLVDELGEPRALEHLMLSRAALARVLAGLPVRRGTVALVRLGLAEPYARVGVQR